MFLFVASVKLSQLSFEPARWVESRG